MKQFLKTFLTTVYCILKHIIAIKIYQNCHTMIWKFSGNIWLFEYNESTTQDSWRVTHWFEFKRFVTRFQYTMS